MAIATSRTGRTIARRAFFTPTPSTEQNSSKNSRSTSLKNPISRGVIRPCIGLPSKYSIVCRLISSPMPLLQLPAREVGNQDFVFEGADAQRQLALGQQAQQSGDPRDQEGL